MKILNITYQHHGCDCQLRDQCQNKLRVKTFTYQKNVLTQEENPGTRAVGRLVTAAPAVKKSPALTYLSDLTLFRSSRKEKTQGYETNRV